MIPKSPPLLAVPILGFLLGSACAAEIKSDECGLASVYATVTEETASGEDTLPRILPPLTEHYHLGHWSRSTIKKADAPQW